MKSIKKNLFILSAVALVATGCSNTASPTPTPTPTPTSATSPSPTMAIGQTVEVTVIGNNFAFDPGTIRVKKGDRVKLTFQNQTGTHDWVLDEFNAQTSILQGQKSETIEFVADKVGTFEYYCSVGTHRQMGMKGAFIIVE